LRPTPTPNPPTPNPTAVPINSPESNANVIPTFPPEGDEPVEEGASDDNDDDPDINETPPPFQADDQANAACEAAKTGQVYTTTVSYTLYYQYELLTSPSADWKEVVWPAVDASFSTFLAREMVICGDDDEAESTNGLVQGMSPDPHDSFGIYDDTGNATSSCANLQDFDVRELICDTVTGSITIFLDEAQYMDQQNVSQMQLEIRNEVYRLLRESVNGEEGRRSLLRGQQRQLKRSDFVDEQNGIYGLYFVNQPTGELDDVNAAGGPSLTESIKDSSSDGDGSDSEQTLQSSSRNVNPAVAASLAGLTMFVMLGVALVIHRNRRASDDELTDLSLAKPIQTKSLSLDGSEFDNHESPVYENNDDDDDETDLPMQTMNTTTDSDSFPIQDAPNPFRELFSIHEQSDAFQTPQPMMSRSSSLGGLSRSNAIEDEVESTGNTSQGSDSDVAQVPGYSRKLSYSEQEYTSSCRREAPTEGHLHEMLEDTPNSFRPSPESRYYAETPNTAYRTMYTVEETVDEDGDFDFSCDGMSMRLTSPEMGVPVLSRKPFHPIQYISQKDNTERDPPEEKREHRRLQSEELKIVSSFLTCENDDSPSKSSAASLQSPGTPSSEKWTTRTISVGNSASTSLILRAANQVLNREGRGESSTVSLRSAFSVDPSDGSVVSLGSSVEPPPTMTPSPISSIPMLNGQMNESVEETPKSGDILRTGVPTSASTGLSTKFGRGLSFISLESVLASRMSKKPVARTPEYFTSLHCENTSTPRSFPKIDPPGSSECSRIDPDDGKAESPESQGSSASKSEYLKGRRRAMEEHFQNYKSRLSESMSKDGGSYLTLRDEANHSAAVDDNGHFVDGDEYSDDGTSNKRCFNMKSDGEKENAGAFPKREDERKTRHALAEKSPKRTRSRTPKKLKSRRDYSSLNDIEDLLDRDQEWRQADEEEAMRIDAFVSARSRSASRDGLDEVKAEQWEESKKMESMGLSPSYISRMETRIYPEYQSDTVQL
jgi:hypothetical protein